MRFYQILNEMPVANSTQLSNLQQVIGKKIKSLPQTEEAFKTLKEIEDLLQNVNAGGRIGLINSVLSEIPDETVRAAQRELARYIGGIDMSPGDRADLFAKWKADELINHKLLLTGGKHTFAEIVNGYNTNPAIKELTDDLSRVVGYGHGKGEFVLNVFSKRVGKGEKNKGDLLIDGKSIEVKTTDQGGARFGDQEVKPGADYFSAVANFDNTIIKPLGQKFAKSGINVGTIQQLYQTSTNKKLFAKLIGPVVKGLYPEADTSAALAALLSDNYNQAKQEFAKISLDNYLKQKKDYGVLYIDISKDPFIFIFFRNNDELNEAGFRLDISTQYLVTYDTQRVAAQFTIQPSSRLSAEKLQSIIPQKIKGRAGFDQIIMTKITDWVKQYAGTRNVVDPEILKKINKSTYDLAATGLSGRDIVTNLEKTYPALKVKKTTKKK
jgi:hypothetical protein